MIGIILVMLIIPCSGIASVWNVPADFATIQSAVDQAASGDTISIASGVYSGAGNTNITISGKSLVIQGSESGQDTTISGENQAGAFIIWGSDARNTHIRNIRVFGCAQELPGAIAVSDGAHVRISNCKIENCIGGQNLEGGAIRFSSATGELDGVRISTCYAGWGGGVSLFQGAEITISDSSIDRCQGGAVFLLDQSSAMISRCNFSGNNASDQSDAGAVACHNSSSVTIERSVIENSGNVYSGSGAIYSDSSQVQITNSFITGNSGKLHGSAIIFNNNSTGAVLFCTFTDNRSDQGSAVNIIGSNIDFKNDIFWDTEVAVELNFNAGVTPQVIYCDVHGGQPGLGNFNSDPGFLSDTDFHLTETSPCIDTGINVQIDADFDGQYRPNGANVDVGADEYYKPVDLKVELDMPAEHYRPGDAFYLKMHLINGGDTLRAVPVFCILDVWGTLYFWPEWNEFSYSTRDIHGEADEIIDILPQFLWPEGAGTAENILFYGGCTNTQMTDILGSIDSVAFGWSE